MTDNRLPKSQGNLKTDLRLISGKSQSVSEINLRESLWISEIPLRSRPISPLDFEITHFLTSLFIEPGVTGEKV